MIKFWVRNKHRSVRAIYYFISSFLRSFRVFLSASSSSHFAKFFLKELSILAHNSVILFYLKNEDKCGHSLSHTVLVISWRPLTHALSPSCEKIHMILEVRSREIDMHTTVIKAQNISNFTRKSLIKIIFWIRHKNNFFADYPINLVTEMELIFLLFILNWRC